MIFHKRRHFLQKSLLVREPSQKTERRLTSFDVMSETADPPLLRIKSRRRRLAEVMARHRESNDQVLVPVSKSPAGKGVKAKLRVLPHVTFRMPFGILLAADETFQLGEIPNPSRLAQEFKSAADLNAFRQQLRPFLKQPFGRQSLDCHRAADLDRLRRRT